MKEGDKRLLFKFAPGLRGRVLALRGDKTLTGLINDVLREWAERQEQELVKKRMDAKVSTGTQASPVRSASIESGPTPSRDLTKAA